MSNRVTGLLAAALCIAALAVPSTAGAITRAIGEGAYAKTANGWVYDCVAQPIGAYIVSVPTCYVEEINGSARLCARLSARELFGATYTSSLQCTDPNAPGAALAGAGTFRG